MNLIRHFASNFFTRAQVDILLRVVAALCADGRYTPIEGGHVNVTTVVPASAIYDRIGDTVRVSLRATVTPTAAGACEFTLSLPIDPGANFVTTSDGIGCCGNATVNSVVAARTAKVAFTAANTTPLVISATFAYRVQA